MELTVLERLLLLNMLPAEGDLTTIRIVHNLRQELSFSEEEHAKLQFAQDGGNVQWQEGAIPNKVFDFAPKAAGLIAESLSKLDKEKKVKPEHLGLFDKFKIGG